MATYDDLQQQQRGDGIGVPWPYSRVDALQDPYRWYTFRHADTFEKDVAGYQRIQDSGDVNALALFVAHHPFVTEALLQLTMVLYQTNQSQNGLALLQQTLWIYECAALMSFQPTYQQGVHPSWIEITGTIREEAELSKASNGQVKSRDKTNDMVGRTLPRIKVQGLH